MKYFEYTRALCAEGDILPPSNLYFCASGKWVREPIISFFLRLWGLWAQEDSWDPESWSAGIPSVSKVMECEKIYGPWVMECEKIVGSRVKECEKIVGPRVMECEKIVLGSWNARRLMAPRPWSARRLFVLE